MTTPILEARGLEKVYTRGWLSQRPTFSLKGSFRIEAPEVVGVLGPNGAGKTTLFELLAGSSAPTRGQVLCDGRDVHTVKYHERDRLVVHYHQSYQVRAVRRSKPSFLLQPAHRERPLVHLFDEPPLSAQDGYVGFMLGFFEQLRQRGSVVMLCLHPREAFHLQILRQYCQRFLFVAGGHVTERSTYEQFLANPGVREYLGDLAAAPDAR